MQSDGTRTPIGARPIPPVEPPYEEHETEEMHVHLPPLTIWPITAAAGITLGGAGLVTSPFIGLIGLLILIWAIVSWIQELRHEREHQSH
jgi:hypothetical protein